MFTLAQIAQRQCNEVGVIVHDNRGDINDVWSWDSALGVNFSFAVYKA